jgi:hypothetical protein
MVANIPQEGCPELGAKELKSLDFHCEVNDLFGYMATYLTFALDTDDVAEKNKWCETTIKQLMYMQHSGRYKIAKVDKETH